MRRANNGKNEGSRSRSFPLPPPIFSSLLVPDVDAPLIEVMTRFVIAGGKIDGLASFLTSPFFPAKN
jgi:hypothetical protein